MSIKTKLDSIVNSGKAFFTDKGVRVYWWANKKNFGDLLTPELLRQYNFIPIWKPISKSNIVGVGSLIQMAPENYAGTILGSGLISDTTLRIPNAKIAAVRGELTKKNLDLPQQTNTGDLGLLAPKLIKHHTIAKKYEVGLVPHYVDKMHPFINQCQTYYGDSLLLIDVQDSAENVTRNISQCNLIVSSSLHGIIVADSLNIPNIWIKLSSDVIGDGYKFHDYNSSIDYEQQPFNVFNSTSVKKLESKISNKSFETIKNKSEQLEKIFLQTIDNEVKKK